MTYFQSPYLLVRSATWEDFDVYHVTKAPSGAPSLSINKVACAQSSPKTITNSLSLFSKCDQWNPPSPHRRSIMLSAAVAPFPDRGIRPYLSEWFPKSMSFEPLFDTDDPLMAPTYSNLTWLASGCFAQPSGHDIMLSPFRPLEFTAKYYSNHLSDLRAKTDVRLVPAESPLNPPPSSVIGEGVCVNSGVLLIESEPRDEDYDIYARNLVIWLTVYHLE